MQFGPKLSAADNLVLALDAGNLISYPGSGTTWTDLSGNRNNGTLTNGPTFDSANGGSIVFDGTDDFVTGSLSTITNWSMCVWYLSTDITSKVVFYPFGATTTISGIGFGGTLDATVQNRWYFFDGTTIMSNVSTSVTTNVWYNLVVTKNSTTYNLYTNGVLSMNTTGTNVSLNTYSVGRRGDAAWHVKGKIAAVQIYNRSLTSDEVLSNFNIAKSRFGL